MLTFATYILYAYVALPLIYTTVHQRLLRNPKICPLLQCLPQLVTCLREKECKEWIDQIQACTHPNSNARKRSAESFAHVQHPNDAAYCNYQCFDSLTTDTALDFLECIGKSDCIEKATYSDQCYLDIRQHSILTFETIPSSVWQGGWHKLYSTGWDLWPCQWTVFSPPHDDHSDAMPPEDWMTNWPTVDNVWRMDLTWRNSNINNVASSDDEADVVTFHMCNEMYPHETWDFSDLPPNNYVLTPEATLKTRAVMWGTEAHENWYLLHYDDDKEIMLIYYCAYTEAVDRFDSMAMVLQKKQSGEESAVGFLTEEDRVEYEQMAKEILGPVHGNLQRIPDCQ